MSFRTAVFALAALAFPLAAWAQSPPAEPNVRHPPGAHQPVPSPPHPPGAHEPAPPPPHPSGAHEPSPPMAPSAPHSSGAHRDKAPPEMPKAYVPGLEVFMSSIQSEHAKLWYAGRARNWPLAAYTLSEIKEVMSDVQDFVPTFRNLPLADMLDAVITGEIAQLEKAVDAKDRRAFAAGYAKLTAACNACHQETGNGFIRIRRPRGRAFPNQDFRPRK
jgi:cytochrome c553